MAAEGSYRQHRTRMANQGQELRASVSSILKYIQNLYSVLQSVAEQGHSRRRSATTEVRGGAAAAITGASSSIQANVRLRFTCLETWVKFSLNFKSEKWN